MVVERRERTDVGAERGDPAHRRAPGAVTVPPSHAAPWLALQRSAGNRAVTRHLARPGRAASPPWIVQRRGPQLPTLDAAGTEATKLPEAGLTAMDGEDMAKLGPAGRQAWYATSLAKLHDQIDESAARYGLPPLLLAATILNEMADIKWTDVAQMGFKLGSGSLGIAQVQVDTALATGVLPTKHFAEAARLLRIPQWSIETAAAELARIIKEMNRHLDKPWQRHFAYAGGAPGALFSSVSLAGLSDHAAAIAMVVAAYNSPSIVRTRKEKLDELFPGLSDWEQLKSEFSGAIAHATNAHVIADEMVDAGIFASSS